MISNQIAPSGRLSANGPLPGRDIGQVSTDAAPEQCIVAGHGRCGDVVVVSVVESAQIDADGPRTVPACEDHAVGCLLDDVRTTVLPLVGREREFVAVLQRAGQMESVLH